MTALICGSFAYDTIMIFPGRFRDHILPDKIHMLNVSFLVPQMRREFGGCAGNIAYNLKMLGGDAYAMGTIGHDFSPYAEWMDDNALDRRYLRPISGAYTAQAYITTDLDDNQITAFHPGAMNHSHENDVPTDAGIRIGIVAPDGRDGMVQHARQFADAGIPFIFDPGQGLPMFNGEELLDFVSKARWLAVNDYEAQLFVERTGRSLEALARGLDAVVVTRGAHGSHVYTGGSVIEVPAAKVAGVKDPTGCGDAYRAGLLYGLVNGCDWETTGRIASLMGAIKIEHPGTQNHRFARSDFDARFRETFGRSP
jgi:adenosine kinase